MIPLDECHITEKWDSDSKWSFLHIWIMNFKEMTAEPSGSQNLPTGWAASHALGCQQHREVECMCSRAGETC